MKNDSQWRPITRPPRNTSESSPVDLWIDVPACDHYAERAKKAIEILS